MIFPIIGQGKTRSAGVRGTLDATLAANLPGTPRDGDRYGISVAGDFQSSVLISPVGVAFGTDDSIIWNDVLSLWTKLEGGNASEFGTFLASDGTAAAPSYSFENDPNTGMFSSAADAIGFSTNGAERLTISSSEVTIQEALVFHSGGAGITTNSTTMGMKLASYSTTVGIGAQTELMEFIVPTSAYDYRWGYGASNSLTETMFLDSANGTLKVLNNIRAGFGSAASPGLAFHSDTDTGLFRSDANDLGIATGGSVRMNITSTALTLTGVTAICAASTTSLSSLNLPDGTAPTSPADGDIWQDGSDIVVHIGGASYTLDKTAV